MARQTDTRVVSARVSESEQAEIDRAAEEAKQTRNAWLRRIILAAARKGRT